MRMASKIGGGVALCALLGAAACAPISDEAKQQLAKPVDCRSADSDIAALQDHRASQLMEMVSGPTIMLPPGVVAALARGRGDIGDQMRVAGGAYNQDIDNKIAQIKAACGQAAARPAPAAPQAAAPAAPQAAARPVAVPASARVVEKLVVYFPYDSSKITPAERTAVLKAIDSAKAKGATRIRLAGHADLKGTDPYNFKLSEKRAAAIAETLVNAGVSPQLISQNAYGATQPAVRTERGVALRENRRVEIEISQ